MMQAIFLSSARSFYRSADVMELNAIAKEGNAQKIQSGEFIKKYSLRSSSSIQSAAKKQLERDLIVEQNMV